MRAGHLHLVMAAVCKLQPAPRAPTLRMADSAKSAASGGDTVGRARELTELQGQTVSSPLRRGAICAVSAWAFATVAGTAAAMADQGGAVENETEQQSIEAEVAC